MMRAFTSPSNPTAFKALVWDIVRRIPPGKVSTYGQIASMISSRRDLFDLRAADFLARWVGGAMAACPRGVPWQRVVNGRGRTSLPPARGGDLQKKLLAAEGVEFSPGGTIEFERFGWNGPGKKWLQTRNLEKPFPLAGSPHAGLGIKGPVDPRHSPANR